MVAAGETSQYRWDMEIAAAEQTMSVVVEIHKRVLIVFAALVEPAVQLDQPNF